MADSSNKRNSVAGKVHVATPKAAAAAAAAAAPAAAPLSLTPATDPPAHDIVNIALGARIQVTTVHPDNKTYEGVLYVADRVTNLIAINCTPAPPNPSTSLISQPGDYHIISIRHIQDFLVISDAEESNGLDTGDDDSVVGAALDPVLGQGPAGISVLSKNELRRLQDREAKAVQKKKDDERKKGTGVSVEAQELFYVLDRMYTSRWDGQSIILMDSVRIDPPYGPEDVKAPKDNLGMLAHLKKVVEGERKKIASRVGTPPTGNRKGG